MQWAPCFLEPSERTYFHHIKHGSLLWPHVLRQAIQYERHPLTEPVISCYLKTHILAVHPIF